MADMLGLRKVDKMDSQRAALKEQSLVDKKATLMVAKMVLLMAAVWAEHLALKKAGLTAKNWVAMSGYCSVVLKA